MTESLRYAVVGCSGVGNTHAKAIAELDRAELVACCDINNDAAATFGENYGVDLTFTDVGEMVEKADVDALSVCTPSGTHADLVIEAANAGADILCEKPLDVYAEQINAMLDAVDDAGVTLGTVFQRRLRPEIRGIKTHVDEGGIGQPILGDVRVKWFRSQSYYDSGDWRGTRDMDGGCMMNQGVHDIDIFQWLMGDVTAVTAMTGTIARKLECEDTAVVAVEFDHGGLGAIEVTTAVNGGTDSLELNGTEGSIRLRNWNIEEAVVGDGETSQYNAETAPIEITPEPHPHGTGHIGIIADFVDAILNNRKPEVTGKEGRNAVDIVLAAYRSADESRRVELDELRE